MYALYAWQLYLPLPEFSLAFLTSFSCIWLFHPWRKKNWKFTFCSGKEQNITVCEKFWEWTREQMFILCSSLVLTSSALPSSHLSLNHLVPHNPLSIFLRGLSLFHSFFMKKRFWSSKKKNHRMIRLYHSFLRAYTYEGLKLEESLWKPCENSCRFRWLSRENTNTVSPVL